jgi:hypothetical protein
MSFLTTVNSAFKVSLSEEELAIFIKSGIFPRDFSEHIFTFFTEVPSQAIFRFILKYNISLQELKDYYEKHIKPLYRNRSLEEIFEF